MASNAPTQGTAAIASEGSNSAVAQPSGSDQPVEMSTLQPQSPSSQAAQPGEAAPAATSSTTVLDQPESTDDPRSQSAEPSEKGPKPVAANSTPEAEATAPSEDLTAAKPETPSGPTVVITLLLTSGARHPYKIDEKYLRKRNVTVEAMDPYNISVYTLKELIWRDWREEWEPRPTSPGSIRLIHFGRMLDDKQPLKECRFQHESPNVVHMTVKPQELLDEEDAKTSKGGMGRDRDGSERSPGCRCVIL